MTTGTYRKDKFKLERVHGSARLGWTTILGQFRLGSADDLREPVDVSAASINDGYTIGETGELSIDPASGSASIAVRGDDLGSGLTQHAAVEASYDDVVIFAGTVSGVELTSEASPKGPAVARVITRATYTLASIESRLLAATEAWLSLPEETALARLQRWFTVDATDVADERLYLLDTLMPAEREAGSASRLDVARAFSAATGLPLRMRSYLSADPNSLVVLDPAGMAPAIDGADTWAHAVKYKSEPGRAALQPQSVEVATNDMRLTGGQQSVAIEPAYLGSTFRLGVSRLGAAGYRQVGFLAGQPVDLFGRSVPVARVSQTFGKTYSASLELAPGSVRAGRANLPSAPIAGADAVSVAVHGALGDGQTDSGAGINAAILASTPGSAILFPGGTYILEEPMLIKANRAYIAQGTVILKQKAGTELDCMVKVRPDEPTPRRDITWYGIHLDGNAMSPHFDASQPESTSNVLETNNTVYRAGSGFDANHGMLLEAVQFSNFIDLAIRHVGGTGLILRGLDPGGVSAGEWDFGKTTSTLHFVSPYIYACGLYGVFFAERSDDNHIDFGDIGAAQFETVYVIAGSNSVRNTTIWGSKRANGVLIGAPTNQVIGCQIEGHAQHGVKLVDYAAHNFIASNKIYLNSGETPGAYDGINLNSASSEHPAADNTIVGNTIYAGIGAFYPSEDDYVGMRHGIAIEDNTARTFLAGNRVELAGPGALITATPGVYGLKTGDTYNGVLWTDYDDDAARLAASPRGLIPGALRFRDEFGALHYYTGPSRDRIERLLTSDYDTDGGILYLPESTTTQVIYITTRFDTNYCVNIAPGWNTGGWWITDKATDHFTVHFVTGPGSGGAPMDWTLLRQGG